jgi:hypothetical protein
MIFFFSILSFFVFLLIFFPLAPKQHIFSLSNATRYLTSV